jgi:predicted nucleotidyltransferase
MFMKDFNSEFSTDAEDLGMDREKFTEKLVRMIETIESGVLPARVREFYTFGSYARGAMNPDDLDVIVVHDSAPPEYDKAVRRHLAERFNPTELIFKAYAKFKADMCRPLRKPGEKIEILLARKIEEVIGLGSKIQRNDLILLWSEADPHFRAKLNAIRPDPAAGPAPRNHLFSLKRLRDGIATMERTVQMVQDHELLFTRIPIEGIQCQLNADHTRWLERWQSTMGKASHRILPYAFWWFESHRQTSGLPNQGEIWSRSNTHRVHLGHPSLGWMVGNFLHSPKLKRQCLIPHIKKGQPNELLVFERGVNWSNAKRREN